MVPFTGSARAEPTLEVGGGGGGGGGKAQFCLHLAPPVGEWLCKSHPTKNQHELGDARHPSTSRITYHKE
jgi:hypothetical protein